MQYKEHIFRHTKDFYRDIYNASRQGKTARLIPRSEGVKGTSRAERRIYLQIRPGEISFALTYAADPFGFQAMFIESRAKKYMAGAVVQKRTGTADEFGIDELGKTKMTIVTITHE